MAKDDKTENANIVTHDVLRGKPYLDIDRVILDSSEGKPQRKK